MYRDFLARCDGLRNPTKGKGTSSSSGSYEAENIPGGIYSVIQRERSPEGKCRALLQEYNKSAYGRNNSRCRDVVESMRVLNCSTIMNDPIYNVDENVVCRVRIMY